MFAKQDDATHRAIRHEAIKLVAAALLIALGAAWLAILIG